MITINIEDENNVEIQDSNLHLLDFDTANIVKKVSKNANETEVATILNENGTLYAEKTKGNNAYRVEITENGLMATKTSEQGSRTSKIATLDDIGDAENDVIEGYYYNGAFYEDAEHTQAIIGASGKVYIDLVTDYSYRYGDNTYYPLGADTSGLQTKITNDNKLGADLVDDSSSTNKFVTGEDKVNWNAKQDALMAGSNITINENNEISATDTTYTAGNGLGLSGNEFSIDTSVVQEKLTAGANITISNNQISATDTTYTAGDNITISNGEISAVDTKYTAGNGIALNGTQFSADTTVLATKNDLLSKQDSLSQAQLDAVNSEIDSTKVAQIATNTGDISAIKDGTTIDSFGDVESALGGKQDTLTFDNTPTENSNNPVKSGGVYTSIQNVVEVAEGKTADYVISDVTNASFNSSNNTITLAKSGTITDTLGNTINLTDLKIGDIVYIIETDVPDRWVGSIDTTNIVFYKMETEKVDLTNYQTKIDSSHKLDADLVDDTTSTNKFVSAQEKTDIANNTSARHTHSNKSILDDITASYTTAEQTKLSGIESGAQVNTITSVNTKTGAVSLDADDIDDTNTTNKFVSASDKTNWNGKQDALTAGSNISIVNNEISATDTTYTAGTGLNLSGTEFSVDTTTIQEKLTIDSAPTENSTNPVQSGGVYTVLAGKQNTLTAGSNISIIGDTISATDTKYTAGNGISISINNEISDFLNPLTLSATTIFNSTQLITLSSALASTRTTSYSTRGTLNSAVSASTINNRDAIILNFNVSSSYISINAKFILTRNYHYNNSVVFSTTYSVSSSSTNITQITFSLFGDTTNGLTNYEISAVAISEVKTISTNAPENGVAYLTTAPSSANTNGKLKIVVLSSEPATRYDGYLYFITES